MSTPQTPTSGQEQGPNIGPEATHGVVADTSDIDLDAVFAQDGGDGSSADNSLTYDGGSVGAHGGIDLGGGGDAQIGIPGGPTIEAGVHGQFGTEGAFEADGSHLDADSTYTTGNDDGTGHTSGDNSLDVTHGDIAAQGGIDTGADATFSISGIPGQPEIGIGAEGEFSTEGGFHADGTHIDADSHYAPVDDHLG